MLSVSIPLFHWGAEFKKVKKAKLVVEEARLDLQKNTRLLSIEARQAVQNLTSGYHMIETAQLGQRQADENLRVMQDKYDVSMATLTDLLEAEAQWQQAHSNLIEAQTQYKIYETEYLRVTGNL
jgi:outer membrane protein TolC